jgi:Subtilase family
MKYIVDFHNDAPQNEIDSYLSTNSCTVLKEWDNFDKVYLVEAANEPPVTSIVAFVKDDTNNLAIKPMQMVDFDPAYRLMHDPSKESVTISTTDQKDWWKNYSLASPVFDKPTVNYTQKGSHVHVYVMDSGIEASHPEFVNTDISYVYSVTPDDYTDHNGHGTALASIISGATCGISSAKIKVVKIFDPSHQTLQSEFLDALDAIMADLPEGHFAILNCSWSIPRNEWVEFKLKECIDDGLWVLAAAGNSGTAIDNVTPAAMPEAFVLGSYNQDLLPSKFSDYSGGSIISYTADDVNHGELDGWAPGEMIWHAGLNGTYGYGSGTSLACAIGCAVTAHNLNDACYTNGKKLPGSENLFLTGPNAIPAVIVGRKDILDLSDPKYSTSVNAIVTLRDSVDMTVPPDIVHTSIRAGDNKPLAKVFNPQLTKSVEIIEALPENFELLPNGGLHGNPTLAQGPTGNDAYVEYQAKVKRTNKDDTVEIISIFIYVLAPNYAPSDLPDDHVINITLLTSCNFPGSASCGLNYNSNCSDNCSWHGCCGYGKSSMCNCVA